MCKVFSVSLWRVVHRVRDVPIEETRFFREHGRTAEFRRRQPVDSFTHPLRANMSESRKVHGDIFVVILLALIVFLIAALATYDIADPIQSGPTWLSEIYQPDQLVHPQNAEIQNACGFSGAWIADLLIHSLGIGAYFLIIGLVSLEFALVQKQSVNTPWLKTAGWIIALIGSTTLGTLMLPEWTVSPVIGAGGYLGALGRGLLGMQVGTVGTAIIASAVTLIGMMMWTEYLIFRAGRFMIAPALVAASAALPFGLLHRGFKWFNRGSNDETGLANTDVEEQIDIDSDEEESTVAIPFEPRSIKIKLGDQEEELQRAGDGEYEELEEDEYDEEYEDEEVEADSEEYDEDEEEPATIPLKINSAEDEDDSELDEQSEQDVEEPASTVHKPPHFKVPNAPKPKPPSEREVVMNQLEAADKIQADSDYEVPGVEILLRGEAVNFEDQKRAALRNAEILEKTYKEFGFDVKVVEIETGPTISQYEISLAPGLRLNKVTGLTDNLAIALRVPSVRVVSPIPGKNTVGVEVPNDPETRQLVRMRDVMEQSADKLKKMNIPLFLGKDAVGAPMVADLAKLPHLLIAGRTGTGKSVCLNAIISSILMTRKPDEVRMLMIDPKMVELSGYGSLPHLMHPVVTDMRKAEAILAWAVEKMEQRYQLLAKAGVRHINSYNQLGPEELIERLQPANEEERAEIPANLPFIVIIADEMADLMMTAGKDVEQHIIRLAQKSRAVGIHLILATQKPTVDVITGLIKSNLPARLAFQVASKTDSRVVLDDNGADKLLGNGDMLFLWPGTSTLLRGQGTYLSDDEINSVTEACSTGEQNFVHELVNMKVEDKDGEPEKTEKVKKRDELYQDAINIVVQEQRGSVSLLQRSLGIGYGRAARLIDYMEEDGIVGPYSGSKAREVLVTSVQVSGDDGEEPESELPLAPIPPAQKTLKVASATTAAPPTPSKKKPIPDVEEAEDEEDDEEEWEDEAEEYEPDDEDYEEEDDEEYEYVYEEVEVDEDDEEYEED